MQEVQAVINNISFPKSLEELLLFQKVHGHYNVEDILGCAEAGNEDDNYTEWTMPRWCKSGDIVFFMHAKTANAIISRLERELRKSSASDYDDGLMSFLQRGAELYQKYGGKIFAIGKVCGDAFCYDDEEDSDFEYHWKSRIYAPIDSLYCLEYPIDISEFNDFIYVSRQSAITPVFGKEFEALKALIMSKNAVPRYLEESVSMPIPLSKITGDNWIQVASQYRRSFFLEIQFRTYYVDYLLASLGDRKGFFKECACIKGGQKASFVDNVIVIGRKYLPVEVKLNIDTEKDLVGQLRKYCALDKLVLDAKKQRFAAPEKVYGDGLLVIDTNGAYWYDNSEQSVSPIYSLDDISTQQDISDLREKILSLMTQ
ncbi:MAG: hypothetical protein IJT31_02370 [Oscillibacter sp.]|nr:hypothetical protein [Oscillibacter sp.]